jgi:hypothetical protein
MRPVQFEATPEDVDLALERVDALGTAWEAQWAPPCTCGQTEGLAWEAKYCPYPNPDGDGCCGDTLLDRLEQSVALGRSPVQPVLDLAGELKPGRDEMAKPAGRGDPRQPESGSPAEDSPADETVGEDFDRRALARQSAPLSFPAGESDA